MADKTIEQDTEATEATGVTSDAELRDIFESGFNDDNKYANESEPKAEPEETIEKTVEAALEAAPETTTEVTSEVKTEVADEWAGVPDVLKNRFEKMALDLEKATNIANSASGRASKLQSQLAKQDITEAEKPKPTGDQIREAMVDKTKRDALREDWGDFAEALDEIDNQVSTAVGSELDKLRQEMYSQNNQAQEHLAIQRNLDINHPGWESTISSDNFKNWIYKDGPSKEERDTYEQRIGYAQQLNVENMPSQADALFTEANAYYNSLLTRYPTWANDRGSLYGDPSGDAAIKLLDMHKQTVDTTSHVNDTANVEQQAKNRQRLAANVAPTSGSGSASSPGAEQDAEAAFEAGFKSTGY